MQVLLQIGCLANISLMQEALYNVNNMLPVSDQLYKAPHLLDMRHSNFNKRCVPFVVGRLLENGTLSSLVGFLLTIEVRHSVNI